MAHRMHLAGRSTVQCALWHLPAPAVRSSLCPLRTSLESWALTACWRWRSWLWFYVAKTARPYPKPKPAVPDPTRPYLYPPRPYQDERTKPGSSAKLTDDDDEQDVDAAVEATCRPAAAFATASPFLRHSGSIRRADSGSHGTATSTMPQPDDTRTSHPTTTTTTTTTHCR